MLNQGQWAMLYFGTGSSIFMVPNLKLYLHFYWDISVTFRGGYILPYKIVRVALNFTDLSLLFGVYLKYP